MHPWAIWLVVSSPRMAFWQPYQREHTGQGSRVDVALLDAQIALLIYRAVYYFLAGEVAQPAGSGHISAVPIGAFKTQDIHIVIDANGDKFWRACVA